MPLPEPVIDDRSYDEILSEALARIPVHNPEWTNFNDSDPGVTILQVFAFMTESLLYRANLVPERNRVKFLRLLGLPLEPASAATGLVVLDHTKGALTVETLQSGRELFAGNVAFRTTNGLDVLPIEAHVYYKAEPELSDQEESELEALYRQVYASDLEADDPVDDATLRLYQTRRLEPPTAGGALPTIDLANDPIDGTLWIALLARREDEVDTTRTLIAGKTLTLGVVPALDANERVLPPFGQKSDESQTQLLFERPDVRSTDAAPVARYRAIDVRPFSNVLETPGYVELRLPDAAGLKTWTEADGIERFPPALEDDDVAGRVITWIRIRMAEQATDENSPLSARFSFVGINAAGIVQQSRVVGEFIGQGTGEPEQRFALVNTPVIADSVELTVNGRLWAQIDDLAAAAAEVPRRSLTSATAPVDPEKVYVYTLDRATGVVRFGDGLRGARPPRGAIIQASYAYGGGREGLVGIGAVTKGQLPASIKASNPLPTWGGDEAESVAEAERRIPAYLKNRDRLVTEEDFGNITLSTPGVDIGRVEVLPLFHPDVTPAPGVVTLMLIPKYDAAHPDAPEPDRLFLNTVCDYLDPRRLITTELHVRGPAYEDVYVSIGLEVLPGHDTPTVREAVKDAVRAFLSPLEGGFEESGWPLAHDVDRMEVLAVAARVTGVSKINEVLLSDAEGSSADGTISMSGLMLPRLAGLAVQTGDPQPLDTLLGTTDEEPAEDEPAPVPIPVVPPEC